MTQGYFDRIATGFALFSLLGVTVPAAIAHFAPALAGQSIVRTAELADTPWDTGEERQQQAPSPASREAAPFPAADPQMAGRFGEALDALEQGDASPLAALRSSLVEESMEARLIDWLRAIRGDGALSARDNLMLAQRLGRGWPRIETILRSGEYALWREKPSHEDVRTYFKGRAPLTLKGAALLASVHLADGRKAEARAALRELWISAQLTGDEQEAILAAAGGALEKGDHAARMRALLADRRTSEAKRMAKLADLTALSDAWTATTRKRRDAADKLEAALAAHPDEPALAWLAVHQARRAGDYQLAAERLEAVIASGKDLPGGPELGDLWWTEQRIISRELAEKGEAQRAYRIACPHIAASPGDIADAEFHCGWYALRFNDDPQLAKRHFHRLQAIGTTPITLSRAHYWLGRSHEAAGDEHGLAQGHYRIAARHVATYYGQLAAMKTGRARPVAPSYPSVDANDRARFAGREAVRALALLEAAGQRRYAAMFYRHLADTLATTGEAVLLVERARREMDAPQILQLARIAHGRGLGVEALAWPLGAVPDTAKMSLRDRALVYAIARQESSFNTRAVSRANARGLLQLLPATARQMARQKGLPWDPGRLTSDPAYNAQLGATYLSDQLARFGNSYVLTFAAYNAGPSRADEWIDRFGDPRGLALEELIDWVEQIPYPETRNYVQRVMENYQVYQSRLSGEPAAIAGDLVDGRPIASR